MKRMTGTTMALGLILFFLITASSAADRAAPSAVGGFTLNSSIDDYQTENHLNYLSEVIYTDLQGFRKGFITYGTCQNKRKILRIKLKYEDGSQDFFSELLQRYKKAFGDNPSFSGDPFGNVKSWKWSFSNEQGQRVTLELQHNLKDTDESIGNMVKLSMPDLMDEERRCFNQLHDTDDNGPAAQAAEKEHLDWSLLIPKQP